MHTSWVDKLNHFWRVSDLDHLVDLFTNRGCTRGILKVLVSIVNLTLEIEVVCWLVLELVRALVGEELKIAKLALLSDVIERAQNNKKTLLLLSNHISYSQLISLVNLVALIDALHKLLGQRVWRHDQSRNVRQWSFRPLRCRLLHLRSRGTRALFLTRSLFGRRCLSFGTLALLARLTLGLSRCWLLCSALLLRLSLASGCLSSRFLLRSLALLSFTYLFNDLLWLRVAAENGALKVNLGDIPLPRVLLFIVSLDEHQEFD